MRHLANLLRAEGLLLRRLRLARLAGLLLAATPVGVGLLIVLFNRDTPPWPAGASQNGLRLRSVAPAVSSITLLVNGFVVALALLSSLGYEFDWGTVRTTVARGAERPAWLAAKVLAVTLADAAVLLPALVVGTAVLLAGGWTDVGDVAGPAWRSVVWAGLAGVLLALVVAGVAALGTVLTRSLIGGLVAGLLGYLADLAFSGTLVDEPASPYLVTWNAFALAGHEFNPQPEPGWRIVRLAVYAAGVLLLAGLVFWRRDITRRG